MASHIKLLALLMTVVGMSFVGCLSDLLPPSSKHNSESKRGYVVVMAQRLRPSWFPNPDDWYSSIIDSINSNNPGKKKIRWSPLRNIDFDYDNYGFYAVLTREEAQKLKGITGVRAIGHTIPRYVRFG